MNMPASAFFAFDPAHPTASERRDFRDTCARQVETGAFLALGNLISRSLSTGYAHSAIDGVADGVKSTLRTAAPITPVLGLIAALARPMDADLKRALTKGVVYGLDAGVPQLVASASRNQGAFGDLTALLTETLGNQGTVTPQTIGTLSPVQQSIVSGYCNGITNQLHAANKAQELAKIILLGHDVGLHEISASCLAHNPRDAMVVLSAMDRMGGHKHPVHQNFVKRLTDHIAIRGFALRPVAGFRRGRYALISLAEDKALSPAALAAKSLACIDGTARSLTWFPKKDPGQCPLLAVAFQDIATTAGRALDHKTRMAAEVPARLLASVPTTLGERTAARFRF